MTVSCYPKQKVSVMCRSNSIGFYIHRGGRWLVWFKSAVALAHRRGVFIIKVAQVLSKSCERELRLSPLLINTRLNRNKKKPRDPKHRFCGENSMGVDKGSS